MNPVRVGVWGVGVWGEKHARVYDALPDVALVGVYDRDPERARTVAERYRCSVFPSPEAMLDQCEAVSIAVATVAHRAALERSAAAGRHALVEKPMAPTVEDADAMLRAARQAGITLQVGHVERFNPAWRAARSLVQGVKFVEAHRIAQFQPRSLDIDVVFDLMIHDIDTVLDCVGAFPAQVSAVGVAVLSDNEDIANARLEFEDGCVANLTASRVSQERLRRIRFFQQDAYLSLDLIDQSAEILRVVPSQGESAAARLARAARHMGSGPATIPADPRTAAALSDESRLGPGGLPFRRSRLEVHPGEPLALELDAFTRSLRGSGPGAASGEAGRAALAVAAEVRSAMKQRARHWALRSSADS